MGEPVYISMERISVHAHSPQELDGFLQTCRAIGTEPAYVPFNRQLNDDLSVTSDASPMSVRLLEEMGNLDDESSSDARLEMAFEITSDCSTVMDGRQVQKFGAYPAKMGTFGDFCCVSSLLPLRTGRSGMNHLLQANQYSSSQSSSSTCAPTMSELLQMLDSENYTSDDTNESENDADEFFHRESCALVHL